MTARLVSIDGACEPRFSAVREEFQRNFSERGDFGAAVAVYHEGRLVCDLWAGHMNAGREQPWTRDTIVNTYSVTKAITATCMHMLVDRGLLDLDRSVVDYWPEFGQCGKHRVQVRHLLTHQAGLPHATVPLPHDAVYDWEAMTSALAASELLWEPGTDAGYHAGTFGWLNGEVLRRVSGLMPADFLAREVAEPLGARVFMGAPESESAMTAELQPPLPDPDGKPSPLARLSSEPDSLFARVFALPRRTPEVANGPRWRGAQVPALNAHGSAAGFARIYACLANGGELDGVRLMRPETIAAARAEQVSGTDRVLGVHVRRGLGYMLPVVEQGDPRGPQAFGHGGTGGHMTYGDPEHGIGFAYVTNQMGPPVDRRASSLSRALYAALS